MGGAKSKFEQTDWIRASGKLGQAEDTIDGSAPTSAYGVYYITKNKLSSQRDFTITDLNSNLLYITRPVPGTLSWFDVFGNGIDDCRLRVQVDLSRRFWVIYRMGIPCFSGQFADREATEKLANDRRENGDDLTATPFLFRKCCIAVSWSRYMAVAMHYGAPEGVDLSKTSDIVDNSLAAPMRKRGSEGSLVIPSIRRSDDEDGEEKKEHDSSYEIEGKEVSSSSEQQQQQHDKEEEADRSPNENELLEPTKYVFDASSESVSSLQGNSTVGSSGADDDPAEVSQSTNIVSAWVQKQAQMIKDNKNRKLKSDPLEGILHLDKPLLLCQEIYDKIIGNHQTSVLTRERAIELLQEDLKQHKLDGETDGNNYPFLADQEEIFAQLEELRRSKEGEKRSEEKEKDAADVKLQVKPNAQATEAPVAKSAFLSFGSFFSSFNEQEAETPAERSATQQDASGGGSCIDQGIGDHPLNENGIHHQVNGDDGEMKQEDPVGKTQNSESPKDDNFNADSQNDQQGNAESQNDAVPTEQHRNGCANNKNSETPNQQSNDTTTAESSNNEEESDEAGTTEEDDNLVAYWMWENTWTTHQMKMHVAADSDLALHVVMTIIVNQVRYERNAIAMTI